MREQATIYNEKYQREAKEIETLSKIMDDRENDYNRRVEQLTERNQNL